MYRAINPERLKEPEFVNGKKRYFIEGKHTLRPPSNIPYVVENLWELYRSIHLRSAPSRRESAFASATAEQALLSAYDSEAQVFKVIPHNELGHIAVLCDIPDAKIHPDIRKVIGQVNHLMNTEGAPPNFEACIPHIFVPLRHLEKRLNKVTIHYALSLLPENHLWTGVTLVPYANLNTLLQGCSTCEIWFSQKKGYWLEELDK